MGDRKIFTLCIFKIFLGFVMVKNAFKLTLANVLSETRFALNVKEAFGNMVVEYFLVHFVAIFYVKMTNLSIKQVVKSLKPNP